MDFKTFALAADPHGSEIHTPTEEKFFDWLQDFKPDYRVHLGDNYNFEALRTGASEADKSADLSEDIRMGNRFLERFYDGDGTKVFLRGNHDERLWRLLENPCSGMARDYAKEITDKIKKNLRSLGARMLPYDAQQGVYKLGKLSCLHGYKHGVGAARAHAQIYGDCVFGHIHRFDSAGVPAMQSRFARSIGCLARHDMPYCSTQTARLGWHHGWAYGIVFPNGNYEIHNAKADAQGHVTVSLGFKSL